MTSKCNYLLGKIWCNLWCISGVEEIHLKPGSQASHRNKPPHSSSCCSIVVTFGNLTPEKAPSRQCRSQTSSVDLWSDTVRGEETGKSLALWLQQFKNRLRRPNLKTFIISEENVSVYGRSNNRGRAPWIMIHLLLQRRWFKLLFSHCCLEQGRALSNSGELL